MGISILKSAIWDVGSKISNRHFNIDMKWMKSVIAYKGNNSKVIFLNQRFRIKNNKIPMTSYKRTDSDNIKMYYFIYSK